MSALVNHLAQPTGFPVVGWTPPSRPTREPIPGRFCRVEPLVPEKHAHDLYAANSLDTDGALWTYLPYGPFATLEGFQRWLAEKSQSEDPLVYAIIDLPTGKAVGLASYLRIEPASGCIEVGHIIYSPRLQRTPAATEAMFLMMQRAFQLGYRRYEWKCDALNAKSRAAAQRLGFSFEGIFRQATIYKGRNRDTAWFSVIDREWPLLGQAFTAWLAPSNFNAAGRQRTRLSDLRDR